MDHRILLTNPPKGSHIVYPYTDEKRVAETVRIFAGSGFLAGEAVILITTPAHCAAIERSLREDGFDVDVLKSTGQLLCMDAEQLMSTFIVGGKPNPELFNHAVTGLIERGKAGESGRSRNVRAFGEMVSILWSNDNLPAAIEIEELWNQIVAVHSISLLCTYSLDGRECPQTIHNCHSHSITEAA
jgi:hypothetical protein